MRSFLNKVLKTIRPELCLEFSDLGLKVFVNEQLISKDEIFKVPIIYNNKNFNDFPDLKHFLQNPLQYEDFFHVFFYLLGKYSPLRHSYIKPTLIISCKGEMADYIRKEDIAALFITKLQACLSVIIEPGNNVYRSSVNLFTRNLEIVKQSASSSGRVRR